MFTKWFLVHSIAVLLFRDYVLTTDRYLDNPNITDLILAEYRILCPLVKPCERVLKETTPANETSDEDSYYPCCADCRCTDSCGNDCCLDKPGITIQPPNNQPKVIECVYAQYRPYKSNSLNGRSFYMNTKCPFDKPIKESHKENCEVDSYALDSANVSVLVPVSSRLTKASYKNKYCALCHGEDDRDLHLWEAMFTCNGVLIPAPPASLDDILNYVKQLRRCNLFFNPRELGFSVELCKPIIDTCNETGLWEEYDAVTEAACYSYRSVFYRSYKNVHCYLCNQRKDIQIEIMCWDFSRPIIRGEPFVTLLDFNQLLAPEYAISEQCSSQEAYDNIKNVCRRVSCHQGLKLVKERCSSMYQKITGELWVMYNVHLTLTPMFTMDSEYLEFTSINRAIYQPIINFFQAINITIWCSFHPFVKLKSGLHDFFENLQQTNEYSLILTDIDYLALDIILIDEDIEDVNERITEVAKEVKQFRLSSFSVDNRNLSSTTLAQVREPVKNNESDTFLNMLRNRSMGMTLIPAWLNYSLHYGFDRENYGILPLIPLEDEGIYCIPSFVITKQGKCPHVIFYRDEFNISNDDNIVSIHGTDLMFNKSAVLVSENDHYVSICMHDLPEDYLSKTIIARIGNLAVSHSSLTILTIVCITLSIISLVITLCVYCMFPVLRSLPGLNNLGLTISLLVFFIMTLTNACIDIVHQALCRFIAITLHASMLSSFSWMFICTWHMARVFSSLNSRAHHRDVTKQFIHYVLYAEGASALVICATILISHLTSGNIGYADKPCFVAPNLLVYSVAIPVAFVIVLNFVLFIKVVVTISKMPDLQKNNQAERHYLGIFVKLSTLTGLTWIFGFAYQFTTFDVFAYIFTILNAGQGVLIMFSFVLNKRVYDLCRGKGKCKPSTSHPTAHTTNSDFTGTRL